MGETAEAGDVALEGAVFGRPGPRHVGIIMDGNGRWAAQRGFVRSEGHRRGIEAVRRAVAAAPALGIEYLTLYSFSSENWSRPPAEVQFLFNLIRHFIRRDLADLHRNGVKIIVIGNRNGLPADLLALLPEAENLTSKNDRLKLVVAFNYGGRDEIVRAARSLAIDAAAGRIDPEAIDEAALAVRLDTADMPDPDLIIRTSGEQRLSNFLLWQSAYSELVFLPVLWPDFDGAALSSAVDSYRGRSRRFGGPALGGGS